MPNDKIYSEIVNLLVKTKYDAVLLLGELDILERSLFKIGEEDFEHTLNSGVRAKTAYSINKLIEKGEKEYALKVLRQKVQDVVFIGITVAFEPTMETYSRLQAWIRENVGSDIAIDLTMDKSILGGAIIEYKGKIVRSTLVTRVDQYFLDYKNANV
jgi:plasmid replication initiation protein